MHYERLARGFVARLDALEYLTLLIFFQRGGQYLVAVYVVYLATVSAVEKTVYQFFVLPLSAFSFFEPPLSALSKKLFPMSAEYSPPDSELLYIAA